MTQPSADMRRRAFIAARLRVQKLNTALALRERFNRSPAPRTARVTGTNMVAIDGAIYHASISTAGTGVISVINAGRPAAAQYKQVTSEGV